MSLVNGRELKKILEELRQYQEPPHKLDSGVRYFSSEEYFEIFDRVVGPANYNVEYSDFKFIPTELGTKQELFSVKCRITIIDDDGHPVLIKEGYGGYVCRYNKQTDKDVNLQNAPDFVCTYAFKTAAKKFGTFGITTKGASKKSSKEKSNNGNNISTDNTSANDKDTSKENNRKTISFCTDGAFFIERENNDGPVYKVNAYEVVGDKMRDSVSQIIFYPNKYRKVSDKLNFYIDKCSATVRKRLRIKATYSGDSKDGCKQYVFLGFEVA